MKLLGVSGSRSESDLLCVGTWLAIAFYLVGVWTLTVFGVLLLSHTV
jgi:hypothetical protein